MERVKMSDVNSDMEVAKQFNRIIDEMNKNETYNKKVEEYNKELFEKGN